MSLKNIFWECFPPNVLGSLHSPSTCTTYVGLILHCNLGKIIIDNIIYYIVHFFLFLLISLQILFSSPDMKAHLSFSYHALSGVRLCVNFFSRTTRPPNVSQNIIGWRKFKLLNMKDHVLLKGEIIKKYLNFLGIFQNSSS